MIKNLCICILIISIQYISATECEVPQTDTFAIRVSSDEMVEIVDSEGNYISQAVICEYDGGWTTIDYASWIWDKSYAADDETMYFRVRFPIYGTPKSGYLTVAVDDHVIIFVNGNEIDCSNSSYNYSQTCDILSNIKAGVNSVTFKAYNGGGSGGLDFRFDIEASF